MSSPVTVIVIAAAAVFAGVGLGWGARHVIGPHFIRRAAARRFAREFATLVQGTELDLAALRGPSHESVAATAVATYAESTTDAAMLAPKPLSPQDQDYYAASWQNVRGEFAESPPSALLLAAHLTANLLLNLGLLPADTARPTELPEAWTFPSARGYREALDISTRTTREPVSERDLTRALAQIGDFYFEMLTLST
ncbi:MAG TPA: hypothetical protein VL551_32735 [Actinospica sp.]|jgi:hypothetical protein|nr:hypothetical protein [Actinospica sp.]